VTLPDITVAEFHLPNVQRAKGNIMGLEVGVDSAGAIVFGTQGRILGRLSSRLPS